MVGECSESSGSPVATWSLPSSDDCGPSGLVGKYAWRRSRVPSPDMFAMAAARRKWVRRWRFSVRAAQALRRFSPTIAAFTPYPVLLPGTYSVKVSAPSFLPTLREKIGVHAGAKLMVNITLTTLFEAIQLVPLRLARWTMTIGNGRCVRSQTVPSCAFLKMARRLSPKAGESLRPQLERHRDPSGWIARRRVSAVRRI